MQTITTIGLDIAKSVFQVHGVDAGGQAVVRRQLKRRYVLAFFQKLSPCLVGIEACASAHHWSRWRGGRPRLRLSRSPTRSPEWSGP
jgi:transposase